MKPGDLEHAYKLGSELARQHFEKTAFLGGVLQGGKFLLGMGNLGAKGSGLARISAHHVGMPVGFGVMGAMGAEEGQKTEAFMKGLAGGLAFNAGMFLGAPLGKRLLAPGFSGKGSQRIMRRLGFTEDAVSHMGASQTLNKKIHGSLERKLDAGVASKGQLKSLGSEFRGATEGLELTEDLAAQRKKLMDMFENPGALTGDQQAELKKLYSQFSSGLYKGGYGTGSSGARAGLKGIRFAKGLGTMAGGMGLGMYASHGVENAMTTHPASVFDARGGH